MAKGYISAIMQPKPEKDLFSLVVVPVTAEEVEYLLKIYLAMERENDGCKEDRGTEKTQVAYFLLDR